MRSSESSESDGGGPADDGPGEAGRSGRPGADRGFVTAEAAVVLPSLVLLLAVLLWSVMAAAARIQCVDGARAGARAAARGEAPGGVRAAVLTAAPRGAQISTAREGDLVRVAVRVRTPGPGPLTLGLRADAVAMAEDTGGEGAADEAGG